MYFPNCFYYYYLLFLDIGAFIIDETNNFFDNRYIKIILHLTYIAHLLYTHIV